MSILKKALEDKFGDTYREIDRSMERKLEVLGLNEEDRAKLECMPFKNIRKDQEDAYEIKTICLENLLGFNRGDMDGITSWLESLEELRKMHNFDKFKNSEDFHSVLNDNDMISLNPDGLPSVTEYDGKYYVKNGGKHRLTIGKCIGIKTAKVNVHKAK